MFQVLKDSGPHFADAEIFWVVCPKGSRWQTWMSEFSTLPYGSACERAQIFVAVLGASNYTFACATARQTMADWLEALTRALAFIDGVPSLIVPDNARALIADPDRYEPRASATVLDFAAHYATPVLPARPYRPQDKADAS